MALRAIRYTTLRAATNPPARAFSTSTRLSTWKDKQDKDSMRVEWQENTKSATDEQSAELEATAFSRDKVRPEEQLKAAESESDDRSRTTNPLDVSPANHEVSKASTDRSEHDQKEGSLPRGASEAGKTQKGGTAKRYESGDNQRIPGAGAAG